MYNRTMNEIETLPKCTSCGTTLELRTGRMTPEQEWCGVWYDHPAIGLRCSAQMSVLYPSKALREQNSRVALVA